MAGPVGQLQIAAVAAQNASRLGVIGLPMVEPRPRRVRRVVRHAGVELPTVARAVGVEPKPAVGVVATGPRGTVAGRRVAPRGGPLPLPPFLVPTPAVLAVGVVGGVPVPSRLLLGFPAAATTPAPGPSALPRPVPVVLLAQGAPSRATPVPFPRVPPDWGGTRVTERAPGLLGVAR